MLIGQSRGYFFYDWSSGCPATAYAIEKLFFCNNGVSFDKSKNDNSKNNTEYWKNVFKKGANERNFLENFEHYESDFLDHCRSFMQIQFFCPLCYWQAIAMDPCKSKD